MLQQVPLSSNGALQGVEVLRRLGSGDFFAVLALRNLDCKDRIQFCCKGSFGSIFKQGVANAFSPVCLWRLRSCRCPCSLDWVLPAKTASAADMELQSILKRGSSNAFSPVLIWRRQFCRLPCFLDALCIFKQGDANAFSVLCWLGGRGFVAILAVWSGVFLQRRRQLST